VFAIKVCDIFEGNRKVSGSCRISKELKKSGINYMSPADYEMLPKIA